ncbi:MAG TPA: Ig-like domain-containing protein [Verrucomicrobiae bacterium]|nr:Ig-like domain-containing protein [Verrucomicrobiae bacterium]
MKISLKTTTAIAMALFCVFPAQKSFAASTTVQVGLGGDVFSPPQVSISVNDSVIWNWQGIAHSTTSGTNGVPGDDNGVPSGLWDSTIIFSTPHFFTNTFTSPGAFTYYCSEHYFLNMTGLVLVATASLPPSIAITNPANGATFSAPANVIIQATVTNGSTAVTNVQFLVNNALQASENSGPFSTTANGLAAGAYTLSAVAKDNSGLSATNSVNISVVTPVTVSLTNLTKSSGNDFQFSYSANIGLKYVVERSANFTTWTPLATNMAGSDPVIFDDPNATNSLDFYRVGRMPNP